MSRKDGAGLCLSLYASRRGDGTEAFGWVTHPDKGGLQSKLKIKYIFSIIFLKNKSK